jgi:hypothetical protein
MHDRMLRRPSRWSELSIARWRALMPGIFGLLSFDFLLWVLEPEAVGAVHYYPRTSMLFATAFGVALHLKPPSRRRTDSAVLIFAAIIVDAMWRPSFFWPVQCHTRRNATPDGRFFRRVYGLGKATMEQISRPGRAAHDNDFKQQISKRPTLPTGHAGRLWI